MIFVKSFLAGLGALIMAALLIYGLAVGGPRTLELFPLAKGGIGVYVIGPLAMWPLLAAALLIFAGAFCWSFRKAGAITQEKSGQR